MRLLNALPAGLLKTFRIKKTTERIFYISVLLFIYGGNGKTRTYDLMHVKHAL